MTKLDPMTWLSQHLSAGARVTIPKHSEWANPPFDGLHYDVGDRFLDFPYLESAKMADYLPPSLEDVEKSTDVIVLNDFHVDLYLSSFSKLRRLDRRREWEEFFSLLRRTYPVKRFEGGDFRLFGARG